jgi:hypothetical protein
MGHGGRVAEQLAHRGHDRADRVPLRRVAQAHSVAAAVLWTALFLAVSIPLTIRRFRARTAE